MKIGVLCLQGAFIEHINILTKLGIKTFEIKQAKDIPSSFDGLILPGGESTTMGNLLNDFELLAPIRDLITNGMPVFGTCAGLLLLSKRIDNDNITHIATMDIVSKRNAYGRQLGSFYVNESFNETTIPMTFIRAPYIKSVGKNVEILSKVNGNIVSARENNQLVTAFHPELTDCPYVHQYFINMIKNNTV